MVLYRLYRVRGGQTTLKGQAQSLVDALHEVSELLRGEFIGPMDRWKLRKIRLEIYTEDGTSLCDMPPICEWWRHRGGTE